MFTSFAGSLPKTAHKISPAVCVKPYLHQTSSSTKVKLYTHHARADALNIHEGTLKLKKLAL